MIDGLIITPIRRIAIPKGDVRCLLKDGDPGFDGFGEAYCSSIEGLAVKAWKCHRRMTVNLVPIKGSTCLKVHDDRPESTTRGETWSQILSPYLCRVTIPPELWFGLQGIGTEENIVLNLASLPHDDAECDELPPESFGSPWYQ